MKTYIAVVDFDHPLLHVQARPASVAAWSMVDRRPIIAGNWKMNPANIEEAIKLAEGVKEQARTAQSEVGFVCLLRT
jgi:hypothetical protein